MIKQFKITLYEDTYDGNSIINTTIIRKVLEIYLNCFIGIGRIFVEEIHENKK